MAIKSKTKDDVLTKLDFEAFYQSEVENFSRPNNKGQAMGLCPFHADSNPSLSVNVQSGVFKCFACDTKGDVFSFYMYKHNVDFITALSRLSRFAGINIQTNSKQRNKRTEKIEATYDYTDENGRLIFQVVRYKPKAFSQRRPDPNNTESWIYNLNGIEVFPYRLPELLKADTVFLVEGERAVDLLSTLGLVASCSPQGAGKWKDEFKHHFKNKEIIILPDNDLPGRNHGEQIANSLYGTASIIKVIELPGLLEKSDVFDWFQEGNRKDKLLDLVKNTPDWKPDQKTRSPIPEHSEHPEDVVNKKWKNARALFPRMSFPWNVLPDEIATSLKQLAKSFATSPTSLPSAAIAIFASTLGFTINVSPKKSWNEPLIFWFVDIRPSGAGKTPAARELCGPLYKFQKAVDLDYQKKRQEWAAKKPKDRGPEPKRAKGFFITDLTLEGLRYDISGHGGTICIMDELSAFLNAQNQYKNKKGSDRESWLCLWEGKPARIVRVKESITISGARVSIFGGIQPRIWRKEFGGNDGMYLEDGTIFRFLPTFEGDQIYPLTAESWEEKHRKKWEELLTKSMEWADAWMFSENCKPRIVALDPEAQKIFLQWRNQIYSKLNYLPDQLKGFVPKIVSYALRFSGVIYCIDRFSKGKYPSVILRKECVKKGILLAIFYLGHIVDALQSLCAEDMVIPNDSPEHVKRLAVILENLRKELDSGRLAIGYIYDRFNEKFKEDQNIKNPRGLGALMRRFGLNISDRRHDANGKIRAYCLIWDKNTEYFLKQYSGSSEQMNFHDIIDLNYEYLYKGGSEDTDYALNDLNIEKQITVDEKQCDIEAPEHLNEQNEKLETGTPHNSKK